MDSDNYLDYHQFVVVHLEAMAAMVALAAMVSPEVAVIVVVAAAAAAAEAAAAVVLLLLRDAGRTTRFLKTCFGHHVIFGIYAVVEPGGSW